MKQITNSKVPIGYSRCSGKKGHIAFQDTVNIICSAMSNKSTNNDTLKSTHNTVKSNDVEREIKHK